MGFMSHEKRCLLASQTGISWHTSKHYLECCQALLGKQATDGHSTVIRPPLFNKQRDGRRQSSLREHIKTVSVPYRLSAKIKLFTKDNPADGQISPREQIRLLPYCRIRLRPASIRRKMKRSSVNPHREEPP